MSATKTKEKIEEGLYDGWDDIRLPFLGALRRRGFQPGALRKYAVQVGVSKTDKSVDGKEFFKHLHALNKEIIESTSYRYFFIQEPKVIEIEGAPEKEVELDLHPDNRKGGRSFATSGKLYIQDEIPDNSTFRLMNLYTVRKENGKYVFDAEEHDPKNVKNLIHWLPFGDETVTVEVLMPDNTVVSGIGEKWLNEVKEGQVIQFERFGFVRCDEITPEKTVFWFAHK